MALTVIQLKQDKNARNTAVPFRGSIWGYPYADGSERSLTAGVSYGGIFDTSNLISASGNSPALINPIRILQPAYGTVVECFCDLSITLNAADNGIGCYLAIGTFADTIFTPTPTYSTTYLNQSWTQINGSPNQMIVAGGKVAPQTLNLQSAIYPYGDPNFIPEAFVLLLCFSRIPTASGFQLNTLNIHESVQGIK